MRVGIIGQPCLDEIVDKNGELRSRSAGGILYSYAALERAMGASADSMIPLAWTSIPDEELFRKLFDRFTHLDRSKLWLTDALTNRVRLIYSSDSERVEHCPVILPPITKTELAEANLLQLDGLFINMISGFDTTLETLEWIRATSPKLVIHLDIHALVLGKLSTEMGVGRTPSGIEHWRRWVSASDSVQMNEMEARWLADPEFSSEADLIAEIRSAVARDKWRTRAVIITRAERGASLYSMEHEGVIKLAPPRSAVVETTGSGDVFGAQFLYSYLRTNDEAAALSNAMTAATESIRSIGVEGLLAQ